MTERRDPYPTRASRWIATALLALVLAAGLAGAALAQAKKGTPPAAPKGAPKAAPKAGGPAVNLGPAAAGPAPIIGDIEPREQMRMLVSEISNYARSLSRNFVVVTLGGLDLLEKVDPTDNAKRIPSVAYMRTIDGIIAPEINFHPPRDAKGETATDPKVRVEMIRLADMALRRGVRIWTVDYAADDVMARAAVKSALEKSYVPFTSGKEYRFARLPPGRPINENPNNVSSINHVRNFLMLTDTSAWGSQEEFTLALAATNYDAIVIDVTHRRRETLTTQSIDSLKYKKLGARRMVLATMNIGEAEIGRFYWQPNWREGTPYFVGAISPESPDKHTVQYWQPAWRQIITGNTDSYLYGIIALGFDGVVLDGVDAHQSQEGER